MEIILAIGLCALVGCIIGAIVGDHQGEVMTKEMWKEIDKRKLEKRQEETCRKEQLAISKRIERAETLYKQRKLEEAEKEYREVYPLVYDHSKRYQIEWELKTLRREIEEKKRKDHIKAIEREGGYSRVETGADYEIFVAGLIKRAGFKCEMTPDGGDQGVDIVVESPFGKIAVQCKFYSTPVPNSAVQEVVAGKAIYDCSLACVVTNSTYTEPAKILAKANNVSLLHHADLAGKLLTGLID